jgi:hypothetical protein
MHMLPGLKIVRLLRAAIQGSQTSVTKDVDKED